MNKHMSDFAIGTARAPHRPSKALVRLRLAAMLVVLDVVAIKLAFFATSAIFIAGPTNIGLAFAIAGVVPLYFICAFLVRAYSGPVMLARGQSIGRGLLALLISTSVLHLILFSIDAMRQVSFDKTLSAIAVSGLLIASGRYLHFSHANRALEGSLLSVLELDDGSLPDVYADANGKPGVIDTRFIFDPTNPTPASFGRLADVIAGADRVIVHCQDDRRGAWAHVLQGMNVHAEFMAQEWAGFRPIGIGDHAGGQTLVVARGPLNFHDRALKRIFDTVFATLALIALSPVFLAIAIAIKLESPGPVFFVQPRIGRRNRLFP